MLSIALIATPACGATNDPVLLQRFAASCARLAAAASEQQSPTVTGLDGWFFLAQELRAVGHSVGSLHEIAMNRPERLSAIVTVNRQLDEAGIDLLLVPVPPKSIIYPDKVSTNLDLPIPMVRLDTELRESYAWLRDHGVEVLDLTPTFLRERFHPEGPLYCRQDSRWSGTGCVVAARAIAEVTSALPGLEPRKPRNFEPRWYTTIIRGDLWQHLGERAPAREELRLRGIVSVTGRRRTPAPPDRESPLVLVGDSHTLIFHAGDNLHTTGAGLADQLAWELGQAVDFVSVTAAGAPDSDRVSASSSGASPRTCSSKPSRPVAQVILLSVRKKQ